MDQLSAISKSLVWLGLVLVAAWLVLWLGFKIVSGAIHLLLMLGVATFIWAAIAAARAGGKT